MHEANPASGSLPHFCGSNVRFLWGLTSSCEQNRKIFVEKKKSPQDFSLKVKVACGESCSAPTAVGLHWPLLNVPGIP